MLRSKKFVVIALLATVVLAGSIGGVALAQTGSGDDSQPQNQTGTLLDRALQIYQEKTGVTIDQAVLKDSFTQAQKELQSAALKKRLDTQVSEGKITQEQADQYQTWAESKPDLPGGPWFFKGPGGFRGMMGGIRGWCGPRTPAQQ